MQYEPTNHNWQGPDEALFAGTVPDPVISVADQGSVLVTLAVMPYEEHDCCIQPSDERMSVWRFLTLPKFIDLLLSGTLHFSRLDLADDPYDGRPIGQLHEALTRAMGTDFAKFVGDDSRLRTYVSCWHLSEHEPASMWKLYSSSDAGIAIRMPYRRLKDVLNASPDRLFLGCVQYGDRGFTARHVTVPFDPAMWKRKSFEHEKEVRALYWNDGGTTPPDALSVAPICHRVPIDLNGVDAEIIVAPNTPLWIFDVVRQLSVRVGVVVVIRRSDLMTLRSEPFVPKPTGPRVPGFSPAVRPLSS